MNPTAKAPDYEVSSAYLDALLRSLSRQALPTIIEAIDPVARPAIQNAWSDPWHPARHYEAFGEAVLKLHGSQTLEAMSYTAMKDRFGDIVLPMLKKSLETTQRSPAAILSKLPGLIELGMRGIDILWKPEERGGLLQIKYPRPVAPHVDHSWRGMLKFVFEVTQASAGVTEFYQSPEGDLLQYRIQW